jgi:hypothetical protein
VVNLENMVESEQRVEFRKRLIKDGVDSRSTPKTVFDSENGVNPEKRATIILSKTDYSSYASTRKWQAFGRYELTVKYRVA